MATIASLLVNLGMNTAGFSASSRSGLRDLQSLAAGAIALNSAMQIAQGGAHLLTGAFEKFRAVGESVRQIGELSDITGASTERLVALQAAAKRYGVEQETLTTGLKKMVVHLGQAQREGGPAAEAFDRLGLSAELLNRLGTDAAFNSIANAISRLPTPAEKAAAAVEIFGRSGADLVNILNLGKSGIDELQRKADELGSTFSKLEAERVTEGMRALDGMTRDLSAAMRELAIIAGPTISAIAGGIAQNISDLRHGNFGRLARDIATGDLFAFAEAQEKQQRAREDEFYSKQGRGKPMIADALESATTANDKFKDSNRGLQDLYRSLNDEQENRNRLIQQGLSPLERYQEEVNKIYDALRKLHNARLLNFIDPQQAAQDQAGLMRTLQKLQSDERKRRQSEQASGNRGFMERMQQLREDTKTPGQRYMEQISEIGKGVKSGQLSGLQGELLRLQSKQGFLSSQPHEPGQGDRVGAIDARSVEAFHVGLGDKPADKYLAQMAQIEKQMLDVIRRMDEKSGTIINF